jgi:hypothetical protein
VLEGYIVDLAGNQSATHTGSWEWDITAPTATIAVSDAVISPITGEATSTITVVFSEAVTGFTTDDIAAPHGVVTGLTTFDNITWTATYTPESTPTVAINQLITIAEDSYTDFALNNGVEASSIGQTANYTSAAGGIHADMGLGTVELNFSAPTQSAQTLVNTTIASSQSGPVTVSLAAGGYFTAWYDFAGSDLNTGADRIVRGQVFDADGVRVGSEIQIGTAATQLEGNDSFDMPPLTARELTNGNVVVAWVTNSTNIGVNNNVMQSLVTVSETPSATAPAAVNTTAGMLSGPVMAVLSDGKYFVAWNTEGFSNPGGFVKGQLFAANGSKLGAELNIGSARVEGSDNGDMPPLNLSALSNGNLVVSWVSDETANVGGFARSSLVQSIITVSDAAASAGVQNISAQSTSATDEKSGPLLVALDNGGYLTVWYDNAWTDNSPTMRVKAQMFDATGVRVGDLVTVGTSIVNGDNSMDMPPLAATKLANGNVVIGWITEQSVNADSSVGTTAAVQAVVNVSSTGAWAGVQSTINTTTAGDQSAPVLTSLSNGYYFAAWYDAALADPAGRVRGQYFDQNGVKLGSELAIGLAVVEGEDVFDMPPLTVATLSDDKVVVSWQTDNTANVEGNGSAAVVQVVINSVPDIANNIDRLVSVQNLIGTSFDDLLIGDAGDNLITGGAGSDTIDGGAGIDTISYSIATRGVTVDLGAGRAVESVSISPTQSNQFIANTSIVGQQSAPVVVALDSGNYLTVWYDSAEAATAGVVRGQLFNSRGNRIGAEFTIAGSSVEGSDNQDTNPLTAMKLANGNVVVGWDGAGTADPVQAMVTITGSGATASAVMSMHAGGGGTWSAPVFTLLPDGKYFAAWYWNSLSDPAGTVQGRLFNADGSPAGGVLGFDTSISWRVEGDNTLDTPPLHAVTLANGNVVVSWMADASANAESNNTTAPVQSIVTVSGSTATVGTPSIVNTGAIAGDQSAPMMISLDNGNYVAIWYSNAIISGGMGPLVAQQFAANGSFVGSRLVLNPSIALEDWNDMDMPVFSAVKLSNNNIAIGWATDDSYNFEGNISSGVAQTVIKPNNLGLEAIILQDRVNTTTAGYQSAPVIAALSGGRYFVSWYDAANLDPAGLVRGQFFDADGNKMGAEIQIGTARVEGRNDTDMPPLTVAALSNGNVVVSWQSEAFDSVEGNSTSAVVQVVVSGNIVEYGDTLSGIENIRGSAFADVLVGDAGNNVIDGGAGGDTLTGGAGNDSLIGGAGSDVFVFVPVDGSANGGVGLDTITDFTTNLNGLFETNEDKIDLTGFFSDLGIAVNSGNVLQYLNMSGTSLQIDRDGGGDAFVDLVVLTGTSLTNSTLDEMVLAGQLVL